MDGGGEASVPDKRSSSATDDDTLAMTAISEARNLEPVPITKDISHWR